MIFDSNDVLTAQREPEVMIARRVWAVSQEAFAPGSEAAVASGVEVGWFSSEVCTEGGAIAIVDPTGPLAELVSEIVRVDRVSGQRELSAYLYVLGAAALPDDTPLAISRRAFLALGMLWNETLTCDIVRIGS